MKAIEERRSIRKYKAAAVEDEKLLKILESARLAPSGSNTQPWHFIVVKAAETRKKLAAADHNQQWMIKAPVFIVCVADLSCRLSEDCVAFIDESSSEPEVKQIIRDTSNAVENILLEAENQGLAACWTGWFEQKDIRPILSIPDNKYVCAIVTLGYADEKPDARPRKALCDIIHYEKW